MIVLVGALAVLLAMIAVVSADFVRGFLWSRHMRITNRETTRAGRITWDGHRCFTIPVETWPPRPAPLRLSVGADSDGRGCPRFAYDGGGVQVVHHDDTGVLLHLYGPGSNRAYMAFVYVIDTSTGRPSLLRVPPGMARAREAVAWTFGMEEREWDPVLEA